MPSLISAKTTGLQNERVKSIVNTTTNVAISDVCTTTLDAAEFNTMVKQGKQSKPFLI